MKYRVFTSLILPLLVFSLPVRAQKLIDSFDGYRMTLELDHPDHIYKIGEKITASLVMTLDGEPWNGTVKLKQSKDYYKPSEKITDLAVVDGKALVETSLDEPGFIHIRTTYKTAAGNTLSQMVGAAVDPYSIKRSMECPADFDKYWKAQLKKQAAVPVNAVLTPADCKIKGVKVWDVQAQCLECNFSGYLAIPENASPKSLPAMVLCHGAGVASSRLSVAAKWAKEGIVVLDFNVHGLPNGEPQSYYANLRSTELKDYYLKDTQSVDSLFFRKMILRLMRAFDIVTDREEWDGKHLIAFGRSQGGAQALIAGGLDPRIKLVCAEIPALCDVTGYVAHRAAGWPKWPTIDKNGNITDEHTIEVSRYVDAINFVRNTKAEVYMTVGYIDVSCPATGVFAVYNEIKTPKHMYHHTRLGHRQTPEGEEYVRQAVLEYIRK